MKSTGGFVSENPLTDRTHAIVADLIGEVIVIIEGTSTLVSLPGVLNGSINVKVV